MTLKRSDVWFVLPAYNEVKRIGRVVAGLQKGGYKNIIVVNDCSRDDTGAVIDKLPVVALHHKVNKGQGAALRTGTAHFLSKTKGKYLVHFDSDGQHRVSDVERIVAPLVAGRCDITTGSRFLHRSGRASIPSAKRYLVLPIARVVNFVLFGIRATDAHNGFRAMNRGAAAAINFKENRAEHATEIAYLIGKRHLRHTEVPVIIDYHEYGQNFWTGVLIGFRLLRTRWRLFFER